MKLENNENNENNMDEQQKKEIKDLILETIKQQAKSSSFIERKTIDIPTDAFSPVNRKFVTLSSNLTARPVSSVAVVGQRFFDTTNNVPIWYTTAGWRNSVGSIVAQNN